MNILLCLLACSTLVVAAPQFPRRFVQSRTRFVQSNAIPRGPVVTRGRLVHSNTLPRGRFVQFNSVPQAPVVTRTRFVQPTIAPTTPVVTRTRFVQSNVAPPSPVVTRSRFVQSNVAPAQAQTSFVQSNAAPAAPVNPFGPRFIGPGLNNPLAIRPNPVLVDTARQIIQSSPNLKARVHSNGEVDIIDEFGFEREFVDASGNDPLEAFEPEEVLEREHERREEQLEQQQELERLRLQQQLFEAQLGEVNASAGPSRGIAGGRRFFPSV